MKYLFRFLGQLIIIIYYLLYVISEFLWNFSYKGIVNIDSFYDKEINGNTKASEYFFQICIFTFFILIIIFKLHY